MKGSLLIVGGGLNASQDEVFSALMEKAGGKGSKIAIFTTASGQQPDELFSSYRNDFVQLGLPEENCIQIPLYAPHIKDQLGRNAITGDAEGICSYLDGVTGVWFTGGNQYFTAHAMVRPDGSDTALLRRVREIYENGGVIGGSSAGAAIMSRVMIGTGNNQGILAEPARFGYGDYDPYEEAIDPIDPLRLTTGLGFFTHGVVDQHFNKRPRLLRLIQSCISNRENARVGYAVSEDTALVYHQGEIQVLGSAGVYIADCRKAVQTGLGCYEGVVLHALHKGDRCSTENLTVTLAQPSPERDYDFDDDYISDGIINSPCFDDMMEKYLLRGDEAYMGRCPLTGLPRVRGAVAYDVGGKTKLVVLNYLRREDTQGYRRQHTSFTGVGLNIQTAEVKLP